MDREFKIYIGTDEDGTKIYWNPCNRSKEYHKKNGEVVVVLVTSPLYKTPFILS